MFDYVTKSGEPFKGKFVMHRPTIGERLKIGITEARELGGYMNVDALSSQLAHIVATFDIVVDENPPWFKAREIYEVEVLQAVYEKYLDNLQAFSDGSKTKLEVPSKTGTPNI
jgi:hypothetical protein